MQTTFDVRLKKLVANVPKEQGEDPVVTLTLELSTHAMAIGEIARFLTGGALILSNRQGRLDDWAKQVSTNVGDQGETVTVNKATGEIVDSVFGGGR